MALWKCIIGSFYFIKIREDFPEEVTREGQFEGRVVFNYVCVVGEGYEENVIRKE